VAPILAQTPPASQATDPLAFLRRLRARMVEA
jgi:hypothetical protein